ncbi:hypothetical protein [Siphonobacter sp. SORGH_AS_0500]|uniref:hypothetical protein n=1 Tax=Siphonobacter sp. SORGH_AS_0500 TaxID=1864824 RepID=UPI0028561DCE|nr:hypothetical protein [Siphonobacter sp. SORGH_AS_0500]MDR6196141.1 hypothetical protein [Siphonobacter sp. SORGH_AS_0500]
MDTDFQQEPSDHNSDVTYTLLKAFSGIAAGAIPIAGPLAHELVFSVLSSPAEKRKEKAIDLMANAIKEIEQKMEGMTLQSLSENEEFITILMEAIRMAMRTADEEKLKAIKNSVVNSVVNIDAKESKKLMFLNMLDGFTSLHMLTFEAFCSSHFRFHNTDFSERLISKFGEEGKYFLYRNLSREDRKLVELIVKDFDKLGLLELTEGDKKRLLKFRTNTTKGVEQQIYDGTREADSYSYRVSSLGEEFFRFIFI